MTDTDVIVYPKGSRNHNNNNESNHCDSNNLELEIVNNENSNTIRAGQQQLLSAAAGPDTAVSGGGESCVNLDRIIEDLSFYGSSDSIHIRSPKQQQQQHQPTTTLVRDRSKGLGANYTSGGGATFAQNNKDFR